MVMKSRQKKSNSLFESGMPNRMKAALFGLSFWRGLLLRRACSVSWGTHQGRRGALHSDALHLIRSSKVSLS